MKLKTIILLITTIFSGCTFYSSIDNKLDQDFLTDFASENYRIAGDLYLDYYNENLSTLSYDYYLTFISKNEAPSAKGFSKIVKNADYHYFKTQKNCFLLALYYKKENMIICDNSNTAFLDSVKTYSSKDTIPELSQFSLKLLNK